MSEVNDKAQTGTLEVLQTRLNVRGVLRQETADGRALPIVQNTLLPLGQARK